MEFNTTEGQYDDIPIEIHPLKEIQTSDSIKSSHQNNGPYSNRSIGKPLYPLRANSPNSIKTLKSGSEKSQKLKTYSKALQKDTSYQKFTPSNSMKSKMNPTTKTEAVATPIQDYNIKSQKLM